MALETAAFIGASFTSEIWHLVLSQGIAFGAGMGFLFTGSVGLVPQWFQEKRSLANSIGTAGSGFGGLTYSLAAHAMIENLGLPWAFRILAILAFAVNGVCSFLARDRNREVGAIHQAFHKELFKKIEMYLYLVWGFFSILGYIVVVFSLASYAASVGFTSNQGSIIAAIFNRKYLFSPHYHNTYFNQHTYLVSQGLGRPVIGLFSDKIGRINIAALSSLIAALAAFFLWIFAAKHFAGAIVYSLFGAFAGSIWPCIAPVAVEVVGLQLLPSVMSITWLVLVLPATFAEVIGLSLVEPGSDGYLHVQVYTGAMFLSAFAARESQNDPSEPPFYCFMQPFANTFRCVVWALRIWKIHAMEVADLTTEEREKDTRDPSSVGVGTHASPAEHKSFSMAFAMKACFSIIKV